MHSDSHLLCNAGQMKFFLSSPPTPLARQIALVCARGLRQPTMTRPEKRALTDPAMLAKIDKLFSVNVGHHIDLPQIVMLGDQSSGKSSTLEGLTRLPFPRDSGLCTRFATQITFRRASASSIFVSIIPGKDADDDHVEATRAFKKTGLTELDEATFSDIMREVQIVMGIDGVKKKTFSSDVLSIEVTGPDQDHLTVIDGNFPLLRPANLH